MNEGLGKLRDSVRKVDHRTSSINKTSLYQ